MFTESVKSAMTILRRGPNVTGRYQYSVIQCLFRQYLTVSNDIREYIMHHEQTYERSRQGTVVLIVFSFRSIRYSCSILGPDLQNILTILRLSYDNAKVTIDLR